MNIKTMNFIDNNARQSRAEKSLQFFIDLL
jgi:hypothetical protein